MGRRSKRNDSGISGLLLINKDAGMTSHDVVSKVRWLAGTRRVGHTGTLDPDATGLLPITLGHCTKLANFLILDEKVYEFELELGSETTTDDSSGEVRRTGSAEHVTREMLEQALDAYRGPIMQRPPKYSAIRIDGKRAHELARAGVEFEIPARPVEVKSLELLSFDAPRAQLKMRCSSGTYVRSVVRDLGQDLGSFAHTTRIHRVQVGSFLCDNAVTLEELEQRKEQEESFPLDVLMTPAQMVASLPAFTLTTQQLEKISMGQSVLVSFDEDDVPTGFVALLNGDEELVGIGIAKDKKADKLLVSPKKVFIAK